MVAEVIHKVETVILTVLALQPERRYLGLFDFEFRFGFPFLAAVERRNGAVVVTMVSVGLENAGRYLPNVPERVVAVGASSVQIPVTRSKRLASSSVCRTTLLPVWE